MPKLKNQRHMADIWCKSVLAQHPTAMQEAALFCTDKEQFGEKWPDWCGLPMAAAMAILTRYTSSRAEAAYLATASNNAVAKLTAALLWSRSKGVYQFDETLAQTLMTQPVDDKLPVESLLHLPEYCCFVEYSCALGDVRYDGFFVWMECDPYTLVPELRILLVSPIHTCSIPIILTDGTIEDSMRALVQSGTLRASQFNLPFVPDMTEQRDINFLGGIVNMVLYLVSDNKDIPTETIKRSRDHYGNPKNIRTWAVGYRIGRAIRTYQQAATATEQRQRVSGSASPRPHIRRAHYHHFWTGPRNDAAKRKLVVRWLPPISVNWDEREDLPAVLHFVHPHAKG